MNDLFKSTILDCTGASSFIEKELVQDLWSGYGEILRLALEDSPIKSVVVKHVKAPENDRHPRGWNTDLGHQRKLKSYQVETAWYKKYSQLSLARLPQCFAIDEQLDEVLIVLEDLDEAGFPIRKQKLRWEEISSCLQWLAQFHASYLGKTPEGLWEIGTYWHIATRPHELAALNDNQLQEAAPFIDQKLKNCTHQTFVHGDAKVANFCFSEQGNVAGVDFQYVGGGCGMKDVAYFIGSCLEEAECERLEPKILDTYFKYLHKTLGKEHIALEKEWRPLYRVAWADFHRFLKGWSPGHWKLTSYSERVTLEVIKSL